MKKLIILFYLVLFASLNVIAKPILSGYNYDKRPVYFEDSSIVSYGKIVTGKIKSNSKDDSQQYSSEVNLMYFCPFDSLERSSSKTIYSELDGTYKSTVESDSSNDTLPISMESNASIDDISGWSGLRKKLKSKCSNTYKKLPRFEIPLIRSHDDKTIMHLTLDTIKSQGRIKSAWVKARDVDVDVVKNDDGTPLLLGGKEWKTYSFAKEGKYEMTEYQIDCKNHTIAATSLVKYDSTGTVTSSQSVPLDVKNMGSLVPNSMGEVIHNFVCSF